MRCETNGWQYNKRPLVIELRGLLLIHTRNQRMTYTQHTHTHTHTQKTPWDVSMYNIYDIYM
jgi:hypothetical protein